jgi:muramoyltetrapeptide carboxypeptidase
LADSVKASAAPRIWPRPLRRSDVVAIVTPSGPCDADRVRRGAEILQSWGLSVRYGRHALGSHDQLGYLSADDATRAADFEAAWCDPATAAVWASRGGYGAQRMLDRIHFDALRAAGPKHFVGFSDITALHARIGRELNQVTIHGPVVGSLEQLQDRPTVAQLQQLIMSRPRDWQLLTGDTVVAGSGVGVLAGGNLSLTATGVGVEPAPDEPTIVILEDIDEEGYRVDRMLTQLLRSGWFDSVVGVIVGDFTASDDLDLVERVVADRLGRFGLPLVRGVPVGHSERNLALPLGAIVRLEADASTGRATLNLLPR